MSNAGKSFQRKFGDEMLLERLRTMSTDSMTDREIKMKLAGMFIGWNEEFKDIPAMSGVAHLKDSLPRRRAKQTPIVRAPTPEDSSEEEAQQACSRGHSRHVSESGPSTPKQPARKLTVDSPTSKYKYVEPTTPPKEKSSFFGGGSSKTKKVPKDQRPAKVSLEAEKPRILQTIAAANQASTNLQNALKHINKEDSSFMSDPSIVKFQRSCRDLRKLVIHYIAGIESEEWVGTLLQTNDGLVSALQLYEEYKQIAIAPDSDEEEQRDLQRRHMTSIHGVDEDDNNSRSAKPPRKPARPGQIVNPATTRKPSRAESESESDTDGEEDEEIASIISEGDENDPFGNQNENFALKTPAIEKSEPRW